ncbi:hypothetical protein F511_04637 [Dorcoceras hygrometricum]|uniref:Core-2/I-branching beta-1,6-N-acetylglucosaminyltransferase family protein n=1 Tax=Dorcoceras hygrometricum TaxID=472368 RepID=A0A2Z7BU82_9LAMI|nr:hypothetical protein F511_04637 [Dorcoceras hygrometricum]
MEEGKDPNAVIRVGHSRVLPHRLLRLLVPFLVMCFTITVVSIYMIRYFGANSAVAILRPRLVPCAEGAANLDYWIKPPSDAKHEMSDDELFWRASLVPRVKKYPFERVPKIAFLFLTKGPLPLFPLWERFFKGHKGRYSIYIHSLPTFKADFPSSSVFYKRQIPSQACLQRLLEHMGMPLENVGPKCLPVAEWGQMSMCDAERRLLANALLDISNERFVLLSESCIPLYNFTTIYNYLTMSKYSFISAFDDPGPYGRGRYNYNMLPDVNIAQWRKGSQWFEISRKLALVLVEDTKFYPKFSEFCKPHCYVDEHYFQTMLTILAPNLLANRSITWVDWSRGGAHPATFGSTDITEEFMKRIFARQECSYNDNSSSVCHLFARKFSPSALQPLFLLAPKYLGF